MKKNYLWLIGLAVFIVDQITKILLINKNVIVIPNILNFTYTKNTGGAFGIGAGNIIFLIVFNIIILLVIGMFFKYNKSKINYKILVPLLLILSGGISNFLDRIFRGYVIDFIDIKFVNFPNFNIADISIVVGTFILLIHIIKFLLEKKKM